MDEAIWYVIGDAVTFTAGLLIAIGFFVAVYIAALDGLRTERWTVFKRLTGVMQGLENKEK